MINTLDAAANKKGLATNCATFKQGASKLLIVEISKRKKK